MVILKINYTFVFKFNNKIVIVMQTNFEDNIGKKVYKYDSNKPFKSGRKQNTVKGVIEHPILKNRLAYTFEEDDTYVECRRCKVVELA